MTVSIFYTTGQLDGTATRNSGDAGNTWANQRDGDGTTQANSGGVVYTLQYIKLQMGTTNNQYNNFTRGFFGFDTSDIGAADTIDSATFSLCLKAGDQAEDWGGNADLVQSTIISGTSAVAADYQGTVGNTTLQAASIPFSSLVADDATFNVWTLNSTGRGNINKSGVTYLGTRGSYDTSDSQRTYISQYKQDLITGHNSNEDVSGDKRPKLTVTHTSPFTPKAIMF